MEITPKLRKLIYGMFDDMIEGADTYVTKSSMWLIFTEEKRWVIEFTNTKTLWFNYNLFDSELKLLSMDCVDSKDIIKEWFESRFLGINVVDETLSTAGKPLRVEDTVQNGVKNTKKYTRILPSIVEDTIQNGVKDDKQKNTIYYKRVEDTIQNGVKNSQSFGGESLKLVEYTIQNGVKRTSSKQWENDIKVDDIIKNGVKDILGWNFNMRQDNVEDTIENGVKETIGTLRRTLLGVDDIIQNGVKDTGARHLRINRKVDDAIENGVKEVKHKMAESYQQKDHMVTNSIITEDINYAIENGVKETYAHPTMDDIEIEDTIQNGVKVIMSGSEWYHQDEVDNLVKNGVKS